MPLLDVCVVGLKCALVYSSVLKQWKPGQLMKPLELLSLPNKRLNCCSLERILEEDCNPKECEKNLFISHVKPHSYISHYILSRWIKTVLEPAGVDVA